MRRGSLLYLTQADPHDVTPNRSPLPRKRLRAYLMFHGMFFDSLMVGDSQFLNNAELRSLLWTGEPNVGPDLPADLALLLDHKVLLPALRDNASSLHDVWRDLSERKVPQVGTERYARFIQDHLGDKGYITYQADAVSALFRDQVLAIFASDNRRLRLKESVRRAVYEYVAEQDTLYYIRLRQWMDSQLAHGRMEEHHRKKADLAVGAAYRHNVPAAIAGSLIDVPLSPRQFWTPIDIQLGRRRKLPETTSESLSLSTRPFAVSPHVLARMPAETLLAIRDDPARRPVMKRLSEFRRTGEVDAEQLAGEVENFLLRAEQTAYAAARGDLRDLIKRRRRERRRANITVTRDAALAVTGLSIWGEVGNVSGYAGLAITAWASIHALRHRGKAYRDGYAIGRAVPQEHRLFR